jgi:hypothetical protein
MNNAQREKLRWLQANKYQPIEIMAPVPRGWTAVTVVRKLDSDRTSTLGLELAIDPNGGVQSLARICERIAV